MPKIRTISFHGFSKKNIRNSRYVMAMGTEYQVLEIEPLLVCRRLLGADNYRECQKCPPLLDTERWNDANMDCPGRALGEQQTELIFRTRTPVMAAVVRCLALVCLFFPLVPESKMKPGRRWAA